MSLSPNIGLGMIVAARDSEAVGLERCLQSVAKHVDEIQITITGENEAVESVAKKYGAQVTHFAWIDDFAAARNYNRAQVKSDWYLWLDADDTLYNAKNLKPLIEADASIQGYYFLYEYAFDESGNCIDAHRKAQLLKNDGSWEWKGAIHEDPLPNRGVLWAPSDACLRIHHSNGERTKESGERNLRILLKEREKDPKEPRTLFFLGQGYFNIGEWQKCVETLSLYLTLSGWDDERYKARMLMGDCFVQTEQYDEALRIYNDAILEKEEYPDAYIHKAAIYLMRGEWNKALYNYKTSLGMQEPDGAKNYNPMRLTRDVWVGIAVCYFHLGKLTDALRAVGTALKADPKFKEAKLVKEMVEQERAKFAISDAYVTIAKALRENKEEDKILPLIHSIPNGLQDNEITLSLKHTYLPPKVWPKQSIAIYCGMTAESWKPGDENGKGIGGSETAVIELSKRLVKMGWRVTVYNDCNAPPEGMVIDGVQYENYWKFNPYDEFDVLWAWRQPALFDYDLNARLKILDLHDVMSPMDFPPERLGKIDRIFVKTHYHRSLYPAIPDEKFVVIGNGIDLSRWGDGERQPNRFIYSSTPNRGLDVILDIWPQIREHANDAELHIFYGWDTFYKIEKNNPERMAWMRKMQEKVRDTEGVIDHGRVGQKQLALEQTKSTYWLYPTHFPEIHCITACEAQAAGCIPLTSGYAALQETQKSGLSFKGDVYDPTWQRQFVDEILRIMGDKEYQAHESEKAKQEAKQFSWDAVAEQWNNHLKS